MRACISLLMVMLFSSISVIPAVFGNPIATPVVFMDLEDIQIRIYAASEGLIASVYGVYRFGRSVPPDVSRVRMRYPLLENASKIIVSTEEGFIDWKYSNETYMTILGGFPVIAWDMTLPTVRPFNITVDYRHPIHLNRQNKTYMFLYALGTAKLYSEQPKPYLYSKGANVSLRVAFPSNPTNLSASLVYPEKWVSNWWRPVPHEVIQTDEGVVIASRLRLDLTTMSMDYLLRFTRGNETYPQSSASIPPSQSPDTPQSASVADVVPLYPTTLGLSAVSVSIVGFLLLRKRFQRPSH